MPAPPQVTEWLRKTYPRPQVDPEWLDGCYAWITDELHLDPSTQMDKIIENVDAQLLESNLEDSMLHGTGLPANVSKLDNTRLRGPPVLVEIVSITEIGHSAFTLQNTRQTRIDKADLTGLGAEADEEGSIPKYPRSMLRFQLSDGSVMFDAMEYRPMPELQLGVTPLGFKMLLNDVFIRRGIGFLEPKCVQLKGHRTQDRENCQDADFLSGLRERLGKPNEPVQAHNEQVDDQPHPDPPAAGVPQHTVYDDNAAAAQSKAAPPMSSRTAINSPFFALPTSSNSTQLLARERFLSPTRSSAATFTTTANNDSFEEVDAELLREQPSSDFGEDAMEIDDAVLRQIELAEMSAMQDMNTSTTGPETSSSSASRTMSASSASTSSAVLSASKVAHGKPPSPVKEIITIDDDDDDDLYYDGDDFFDDYKENVPEQTQRGPPPDHEVIQISDSE